MRIPAALIGVTLFVACYGPSPAHAGVLDKLKAAAQQTKRTLKNAIPEQPADTQPTSDSQSANGSQSTGATQPTAEQNGEDADHPLHLTGEGHCHGRNSATCLDYGEVVDQCMAPIHGYRAKLMVERIDKRLKEDGSLSPSERKNLEEDLTAFQGLAEKKSDDDPTLGGVERSQRYLSDISDEDQVWVNAENARLRNRIVNKCEGADHMGVGHRTELIKDFGPTGDEAVAAYRKQHSAKTAQRSEFNTCTQSLGGLRFSIMAQMTEEKMKTLKLSDKERAEWEADVAALQKAAAAGGTAMPTVDDKANPYRPLTRLAAPEEQIVLSNRYAQETRAAMAKCQATAH